MDTRLTWPLFLFLALMPILSAAEEPRAEKPRVVVQADFSVDPPSAVLAPSEAAGAVLTTNPTEEVAGKKSLEADSRASSQEWNEFFHSRPGFLQANEAYKISFDYKILARTPSTQFYALVRPADTDGSGQAWVDWSGPVGKIGHAEINVVVHDMLNDILVLGIQHGGAASISTVTIMTDPENRPLSASLPDPKRTWMSPGRTTHYADSAGGDDAASGLSPAHPWRSLNRINAGVFGPDDRIYLKAGSRWEGFLAPGGSGAAGRPIIVGRYGSGPDPAVDAAGSFLATVLLKNQEYWDVGHLDVANRAAGRIPSLAGVEVSLDNFGTAHGVRLHDLTIHDVRGSNVKSEGGGNGIYCSSGGNSVKTRFDGLVIEHNHLTRTDRNGITMSAYYPRPEWPLSTHVVIQGNLLEDIGGDGIVPIGCDGCLVARNVLRGGRMRAEDYAAGIWPWACDNTVVEYNEVSGMRGTLDGEGYDSDYDCRNTLFQYNFSHDNAGGFMLICDNGSQTMPANIGNSGTVIRDNISVNDGLHTFHITGPCRNTQIYNNVFYVSKSQDIPFVAGDPWGDGVADDTRFMNNIFYAAGKARFDLGDMTGVVFSHNSFWGSITARPADTYAVLVNPQLAAPGAAIPQGYNLRLNSPLRHAGAPVPRPAAHDFWGHPLPPSAAPDIGAGSR